MTHPSKVKGNTFEREIVNEAKLWGIEAKRAYGSNGLALGRTEDVDILLNGFEIQCKRRKKLPDIVRPDRSDIIQVVREDHGESFAILPIKLFYVLIAQNNKG